MIAELEKLNVKVRDTRGTQHCRRLRRNGYVPAVLYGHGQGSVSLSVVTDELAAVLRHGQRVVDLRGGVTETAVISEMQWDTWGTHVLHLDLMRVSADETIEQEVAVELRGEAPGTKIGGVLEHLLHSVTVQCKATNVPEKLECNINSLELNDSRTVAQLDVPEGVTVLNDAEDVVVRVVEPVAELEEEAELGESAEPEVISRKADDDESES